MGQAFLSRQKASRHMWRNFRIPWEFKLFFFYRHTEMFLNDFIRILTIFGFIASLFRHLRTEKFSKAALFLFHMFHLLPNIRYFSGAAGTKQEQTKCVDNIDEGTYWVDLTRRVEHRQVHGCRSAFTLWGGGPCWTWEKGLSKFQATQKDKGDAAEVAFQFSRKAT